MHYLSLLLLSLPTLAQASCTFWRLRSHRSGYLWCVLLLAGAGQVLAGVAAMLVDRLMSVSEEVGKTIDGFGSGIYLLAGIGLAATITPGLALMAVVWRWYFTEPPPVRVGL